MKSWPLRPRDLRPAWPFRRSRVIVSTNFTTIYLVPLLSITNAPGTTVEIQYRDRLNTSQWTALTNLTVARHAVAILLR